MEIKTNGATIFLRTASVILWLLITPQTSVTQHKKINFSLV